MRIVLSEEGLKSLIQKNSRNPAHIRTFSSRLKTKPNASPHVKSDFFRDTGFATPTLVRVAQKKVTMPKNMGEFYLHTDEPRSRTIIGSKLFGKLTEQGNFATKRSVKLKEILGKHGVGTIKKESEEEKRMKRKFYIFKSSDLRKKSEEIGCEHVEQMVEKKIDTENAGLIEYLRSKKSLDLKLVQKVSTLTDKKARNLNRVCQKMLIEKGESKNTTRIAFEHKIGKTDFKQKLEETGKTLEKMKLICDKHAANGVRGGLYNEYKHFVLKRNYWDKIKVLKPKKIRQKI